MRLEAPEGCGYELHRTREVHETPLNDGHNANYYLLKGPSTDLLVDTGFGLLSLRAHLAGLGLVGGGRPLLALATHEHYDHAGGLHDFEGDTAGTTIVVGAADADAVAQGNMSRTGAVDIATRYASSPQLFWDAAPYEGFEADLPKYQVRARVDRRVRFGDTLGLGGGVAFAVVELPGHTPGSIGLWNVNGTRELYTGDAIYDAELYDVCVDSDKSAYRATMELLGQLDVSVAFPGHEEALDRRRYRDLIECYLAGVNPCPKDAGAPASDMGVPSTYILASAAELATSCVTGNTRALARFLADDFIGTLDNGQRYTKTEALAQGHFCQADHSYGANLTSFDKTVVAFRSESRVDLSGQHGMVVWTDVWAKRDLGWQLVAATIAAAPTARAPAARGRGAEAAPGARPGPNPADAAAPL